MSGRSWKFESSHGHEKQKSANSRFFLLYHYPFRVLFSTYYTKLSLVVVKKVTTTKTTFLFPKSVVQGCPSLSSKKSRQHKQQRQHFYFQKCCPRLSLVVVKTSHDNTNNKDNISILFQKCCPRLSLVVVKKNHLFMKIFIFVSENIKMLCLGNISLSLKSTIRFFLIRISPIQCVKERDGGLRGGSINDGLFHLLLLGNAWVKSLTNLVLCVTEQKMY